MSSEGDRLEARREAGARDGSRGYGHYDPPHGELTRMVDSDAQFEQDQADNDAYTESWREAQKERERNK